MNKESSEIMADFVDEVKRTVCTERNQSYGNPEDNHERTAEIWLWYIKHACCKRNDGGGLRFDLDGRDVCVLNILQKLSREVHSRQRDTLIDVAGYCANAEACEAATAVRHEGY